MSDGPAPYSLRRRLLLWLLMPLGVIALFSLADSYFNARDTANEAADRVLAGSVLAISERVFVNEEGLLEVDIPYVALDMLTSAAQDRVFYRIDGPNMQFVTGYRQLPVPPRFAQGLPHGEVQFADSSYKKDPVRIAVMQAAASSGLHSVPYRVSVAETTIARQKLTQEILLRSALRQVLLILSAAVIVWFAVTRGLRPLEKLEAAIGRRSQSDLRPILHHVPQEVSGLVLRINDFMGRLGGAIEALKNFSGNASHQIRTPLAILRTQIALARRAETLEEAKQALDASDGAIGDAERTLSQLMLLARMDGSNMQELASARVNLSDLARDVTMAYVPSAADAGFDLGFEGNDDLWARGDETLISELLKNLIDNAIKHGKGGSEITVRVLDVLQDGQAWIRLDVQDDGPGLDQDLTNLSTRFSHPTKRRSGAGLGLAIAHEIADLFGGKIHLAAGSSRANSTGKGCYIQVDFQPADPVTDQT